MTPTDPTLNDVLHPTTDAIMKAELSAPDQLDALQNAATVDVRKTMNAMKTVGAALHKAMSSGSEEPAKEFQALLDEATRVARMLMIRWGHNPETPANRWMVNVVEKSLVPYITTNPLNEKQVDALSSALLERTSDLPETDAWQNDNMITIALFRGTALLAAAQSEFDFGRKKTASEDLDRVKEMVFKASLTALGELCPDLTPHNDRVTFLTIILDEAFALMDAAWRKNAQRANQALLGLSKEQLTKWKTANPDGFALDPVLESFEQNLGRLLRLTNSARKTSKKRT